jgi:DNA-binding LacI/PurR family transcriptional regulator
MKPRPTAAITMNDLTAAGVIKALHQEGLRVPDDISVVGFDRTHLAECFIPSLTTVDMHPDVLGRTAADALDELCASEKGRAYLMPLQLVIGESTGPVPKDADCRQTEPVRSRYSPDVRGQRFSDPCQRLKPR